ncbi:MAG: orotidine-5'-phosphate decarboxylase [Planctomycetota bacterium]
MTTHFADRLAAAVRARGTPGIIGIDPVLESLPPSLRPRDQRFSSAVAALESFSRGVLDAVAPHVPAVKINAGFFEALYAEGLATYYRLIAHAHARGLLVIGDVKRGDIGNTARLYARGHLDQPAFADVDPATIPDAVTLAGYLGANAVAPFIEAGRVHGRGVYVLVRPSDPGADEVHEFAGTAEGSGAQAGGPQRRFYQHMAALVHRWGAAPALLGSSGLSLAGAVVAPKDAASTAALRASLPHTPFLVPGYGAQGATAESCRPCFRADGSGAVINASRSVIYAYARREYAHCGADWQRAVAEACRAFAADVAPLGQAGG